MSAVFKFVVVDAGANVSVDDMEKYAAAQQRQCLEHWTMYWEGIGLVRSAHAHQPEPGDVEIRLLDQPTMDGAEGYHDRTADGTPIVYVFVGLARQLGVEWTSIASHEVLEVEGDPDLNLTVQMADGFWDHEVADRVESDSYEIDGVKLSNFNTPFCFAPPDTMPEGGKYDHLGLSKHPNEVRPGGYAQRFDSAKGWQMMGEMSAYRTKLAELGLSRGARRRAAGGHEAAVRQESPPAPPAHQESSRDDSWDVDGLDEHDES